MKTKKKILLSFALLIGFYLVVLLGFIWITPITTRDNTETLVVETTTETPTEAEEPTTEVETTTEEEPTVEETTTEVETTTEEEITIADETTEDKTSTTIEETTVIEETTIEIETTMAETTAIITTTVAETTIQYIVSTDDELTRYWAERPAETHVWVKLHQYGLSDAVVAGIMGNIYQECRFNPNSTHYSKKTGLPLYYGLCQWSLNNYPAIVNCNDYNSQLEFLMSTLPDVMSRHHEVGYDWVSFYNITDPQIAAFVFSRQYERPPLETEMIDVRMSMAQFYYNYYRGE